MGGVWGGGVVFRFFSNPNIYPLSLCLVTPCSYHQPSNNIIHDLLAIMQFFNVPNTNYCATPASTGIDSSKFDKYFDDGYQKQVLCAAHPLCRSPIPLDSNNSPHRCVGCGLHIHCEMFCGKFWTKLNIFTPQLPEYGRTRITHTLQFSHIIAERELCSFGSIVGTVYQLNHF